MTQPVDLTDVAIGEETTQRITFVVTDEAEAPLDGAQLATLTLTIYDKATGAIVNTVQNKNILNTGGGSVDGSGNGVYVMEAADNELLDPENEDEYHVALFTWTWGVGPKIGRQEVLLRVVNLEQVP